MRMTGFIFRIAVVLLWAGTFQFVRAGDLALKVAEEKPPTAVSQTIRALLQPKAIELVDGGKPVFQLWLRQEIPLKSKPSSPSAGLGSIGETTLIGALAVQAEGFKDYKDNDIAKGVYTA